jgi:uncharacterized cupredoxin-like copper-binding protein
MGPDRWERTDRLYHAALVQPARPSISVAVQETRQLQVGNRAASADAVAILDVATRKQRIAARLPFRIVFRAAWADSGTAFIVNRNDFMSHIVMFDRFWEPEGN